MAKKSSPTTSPTPIHHPAKKRHLKKYVRHLPLVALAGFVFVLAVTVYFLWGLPNPSTLSQNPAPSSTKLLDRNGQLIYEIFSSQRRTPIRIDTLPKYVSEAHVASEDADFYKHNGFSLRGISRAFISTFFKRNLQGGSTITQQLVKLALLKDQSRTVRRKVREFVLSIAVESRYSKDQILEMYLNQIPYGGTAYGLESASQTYFGKSAKDLTLGEATLLAGLPNAPSLYSPFGSHPERAKQRQEYVLNRMVETGFINDEQRKQALSEELKYATINTLQAPHFSLWVKDLLIEKYGLEQVEQGGLVVTTTLDLELQNFAQSAIASEVAKLEKENVTNGASVVTNPKTGEILAMVGSKNYFDTAGGGNVNVTLRLRQPGSSIKPLNYATGIDRKLITAATLLADKPTCFNSGNQRPYCPDNYDNSFHGATQVRYALGNSYNIPAVKALVINGLRDFVASASAFGISTFRDPQNYGPALTLGGGEVTMLDMAKAYGVLANHGLKTEINPILHVEDSTGKILEEIPSKKVEGEELEKLKKSSPRSPFILHGSYFLPDPPSNVRVISTGTAFITSHILYDNGARTATFGGSSFLNVKNHPEISVKTGTTNDKRDNWVIGYNPDILVAVWVGNNDNSTMARIASGITGATPIWNKIISQGLKNYPQNWPSQPSDVTGSLVCTFSGQRAPETPDPSSCPTRYEYFLTGTIPDVQPDNLRRDINIFKPTQAPATPQQIEEQPAEIEMQNHAVTFDALGTMLCLDCAGGYGSADTIRLDETGKARK